MPLSPELVKKYRKAGITARKYGGDDAYSWAVFLHGRPVYTGLSQGSVNYYKGLVYQIQTERVEREIRQAEIEQENRWSS